MTGDGSSPPPAPPPPPAPAPDAHKGSCGRVLCLCGCPTMPGAAQLVVRAAQRGGAGLVTLGVLDRELIPQVAPGAPEATYLDLSRTRDLYASRLPREIDQHDHDVRVAGPGLGQGGPTRELVRCLISSPFEGPLVLDADALNVLRGAPEVLRTHAGPLVITPHPGEAHRLLEVPIPSDEGGRGECARELAELTGAVCILKGRGTVVTDGERSYVNRSGNPGMATAGSGDVLCGLLGAYLAASVLLPGSGEGGGSPWDLFDATCAAVHVHGLAGDLAARRVGLRGLVASDLIEHLGEAQVEHSRG